jgi:predicted ribosomally synthesized peptide with nif11-like leader
MSTEEVNAFLDRVSSDESFATQLDAVKQDPMAVQSLIAEAGFTIEPAEVHEAFLERFGSELSEDQLASIAGGLSDEQTSIVAGTTLAVAGVGVAVGAAAAGAV